MARTKKQDSDAQAESPKPATIKTIRMVLDEPAQPGGPTTADVHPDEVRNMKAAGWREE